MATTISLPILALAAILQTTVMPQFRILGGEPDLTFLIVLGWSIHGRLDQSVVWAFVGGIAQDLLSAAPTGTSVVGLLLTVFMVTAVKAQLYRVGFLSTIGLIVAGTLVHKLTYILIVSLTGLRVPIINGMLFVAVPTVVYNIVFILPVYRFVRFIQRRTGGEATTLVKFQG